MPTSDIIENYLKEKCCDSVSRPSPVSDLMHKLDNAVVHHLNGGSIEAITEAFDAVLAHPQSRWNRDTLNYYIRVRHYS